MATKKLTPTTAGNHAPAHTPPASKFDVDAASMALGRALGVAYMCCGHTENGEADFTHVMPALRHVASLAEEAQGATTPGAPAGVREAVDAARAVCEMLLSDVATEEHAGRYAMHWNAEATVWALDALCDVIRKAKAAVDAGSDEKVTEASHG